MRNARTRSIVVERRKAAGNKHLAMAGARKKPVLLLYSWSARSFLSSSPTPLCNEDLSARRGPIKRSSPLQEIAAAKDQAATGGVGGATGFHFSKGAREREIRAGHVRSLCWERKTPLASPPFFSFLPFWRLFCTPSEEKERGGGLNCVCRGYTHATQFRPRRTRTLPIQS